MAPALRLSYHTNWEQLSSSQGPLTSQTYIYFKISVNQSPVSSAEYSQVQSRSGQKFVSWPTEALYLLKVGVYLFNKRDWAVSGSCCNRGLNLLILQ